MKSGDTHSESNEYGVRIIPPEEIIRAYRQGYFPMAESKHPDAEVFFYTAQMRGIIPMDEFRISKRSLRYFKKYNFETTLNTCFADVVEGCADRESTWINPVIRDTYLYLHQQGIAHSIEVKCEGELVGGLYGLTIGGVFFAESVFQYHDEAHKAALYYCHQRLTACGFTLWDVQFKTDHLAQFGCIEIPSHKYKPLLKKATQRLCTLK